MKVLLPVEGPFDAKFIIDFISNYRWLRGTHFKLLHVVNSNENSNGNKDAQLESERMLDELLKTIKRHLPDTVVEKEVIFGTPIYQIIQYSNEWSANMIVMGFRSSRSVHHHLAGSVSRGVTLQAPCSVVVIRPPSTTEAQRDNQQIETVRRQA